MLSSTVAAGSLGSAIFMFPHMLF